MLTNIDIDDELVAEAMRITGARTKREVVDRALREMVARAHRPSVRELFGIGGVDPDYDPKAPWARGNEVGQYRVEEPRAIYKVTRQPAPPAGAVAKLPPVLDRTPDRTPDPMPDSSPAIALPGTPAPRSVRSKAVPASTTKAPKGNRA